MGQYQSVITVFNDGEVAVQYIDNEGGYTVGNILRVHEIDGKTVEQASREEFLADLPINQAFLDDMDCYPGLRKMIQDDIAEALRMRKGEAKIA